jgi:hypothetical protein
LVAFVQWNLGVYGFAIRDKESCQCLCAFFVPSTNAYAEILNRLGCHKPSATFVKSETRGPPKMHFWVELMPQQLRLQLPMEDRYRGNRVKKKK